jgi:hypothetical protein
LSVVSSVVQKVRVPEPRIYKETWKIGLVLLVLVLQENLDIHILSSSLKDIHLPTGLLLGNKAWQVLKNKIDSLSAHDDQQPPS